MVADLMISLLEFNKPNKMPSKYSWKIFVLTNILFLPKRPSVIHTGTFKILNL